MKKFLSIFVCFTIALLLFTGCDSNKNNASAAIRQSVNNLKTNINNLMTYDNSDLAINNETFDNINTDYYNYNNQRYNNDFETAKDTNVLTFNPNITTGEETNTYVNDNNQYSQRSTTAEYQPRYSSKAHNIGATVNSLESVADLMTICNDTICANDILKALKKSLLKDCDDCLKLIGELDTSTCTDEQCNTLYNYCGKLNNCCQSIINNCNNTNKISTVSISNMKNNVLINCDNLTTQYLKLLNNIDCNINCLTTASSLLGEISDYICSITGKCNENSYTSKATSNYMSNYYRPRIAISTINKYRGFNENIDPNRYNRPDINKNVGYIKSDKPDKIDNKIARSDMSTVAIVPPPKTHNDKLVNTTNAILDDNTKDNNNQGRNEETNTDNENHNVITDVDSTGNIKPIKSETNTDDKTYVKQTKLEDNKNIDNSIVNKTPTNVSKVSSLKPTGNVRA